MTPATASCEASSPVRAGRTPLVHRFDLLIVTGEKEQPQFDIIQFRSQIRKKQTQQATGI